MAEDETGFLIEGRRYELPDMGTFTVRESRVFYKETGLVPEVVRMRLADNTLTYMELLENVGFLPALATIAYQRDNTDSSDADVELVIGNTPRDDLFMALLDQGEEEVEVPPSGGVTSDQPGSSPNGSSESTPTSEPSKSTSGQSSMPSSGRPDGDPANTGITESDTWPTLVPTKLVS